MSSCCQVLQDPGRFLPRSRTSIQRELVSIDHLLRKARLEKRRIDVDAAEIVRAALLIDLAAVDTPRREELLKEAELSNLGRMGPDGHWYPTFCILHLVV